MTDRYFLIDQDSKTQKLPSFFIPFDSAKQIRSKDSSKGALEGFLIGAIPGVVLGLALGAYTNAMACSGSDQGDVAYCQNHSDPTLSAVIGLGLLTGGLGALIGALVGHRTVYSF
jgi:hypothetical protein